MKVGRYPFPIMIDVVPAHIVTDMDWYFLLRHVSLGCIMGPTVSILTSIHTSDRRDVSSSINEYPNCWRMVRSGLKLEHSCMQMKSGFSSATMFQKDPHIWLGCAPDRSRLPWFQERTLMFACGPLDVGGRVGVDGGLRVVWRLGGKGVFREVSCSVRCSCS